MDIQDLMNELEELSLDEQLDALQDGELLAEYVDVTQEEVEELYAELVRVKHEPPNEDSLTAICIDILDGYVTLAVLLKGYITRAKLRSEAEWLIARGVPRKAVQAAYDTVKTKYHI